MALSPSAPRRTRSAGASRDPVTPTLLAPSSPTDMASLSPSSRPSASPVSRAQPAGGVATSRPARPGPLSPGAICSGPGKLHDFASGSMYSCHEFEVSQRRLDPSSLFFPSSDFSRVNKSAHNWQRLDTFLTPTGQFAGMAPESQRRRKESLDAYADDVRASDVHKLRSNNFGPEAFALLRRDIHEDFRAVLDIFQSQFHALTQVILDVKQSLQHLPIRSESIHAEPCEHDRNGDFCRAVPEISALLKDNGAEVLEEGCKVHDEAGGARAAALVGPCEVQLGRADDGKNVYEVLGAASAEAAHGEVVDFGFLMEEMRNLRRNIDPSALISEIKSSREAGLTEVLCEIRKLDHSQVLSHAMAELGEEIRSSKSSIDSAYTYELQRFRRELRTSLETSEHMTSRETIDFAEVITEIRKLDSRAQLSQISKDLCVEITELKDILEDIRRANHGPEVSQALVQLDKDIRLIKDINDSADMHDLRKFLKEFDPTRVISEIRSSKAEIDFGEVITEIRKLDVSAWCSKISSDTKSEVRGLVKKMDAMGEQIEHGAERCIQAGAGSIQDMSVKLQDVDGNGEQVQSMVGSLKRQLLECHDVEMIELRKVTNQMQEHGSMLRRTTSGIGEQLRTLPASSAQRDSQSVDGRSSSNLSY